MFRKTFWQQWSGQFFCTYGEKFTGYDDAVTGLSSLAP